MKKSFIFYLIILIVLSAVAWFIFNKQSTTTINKALTNFAVEDTAAIDKIFFSDKSGRKVTLYKTKGNWLVDGDYPANVSRIQTLLETIYKVEVKNPVPITQRNNVIKDLASGATKIEIYKSGQKYKTYYVGGETQDKLGTFMILEGSSEPFVTHIPGFFGFLSIRYFADAKEWQTKQVFPINPQNIHKVKVKYSNLPENSFILNIHGARDWDLEYLNEPGKNIRPVNDQVVIDYLRNIFRFQFEGFITHKTPQMVDSFYNAQAYAIIEVMSDKNETFSLVLHPKPIDHRTKTIWDENDPNPIDEDKSIGFLNNQKNKLVLLQHFTLDHLLKTPEDFIDMETVLAD